MAPPKSKLSPEVEALTAKFTTLGLSASKALEVARNGPTASSLSALMDSQNLGAPQQPQSPEVSLLLVTLADKGKSLNQEQKSKVTKDILDKKLASADQVSGQLAFLLFSYVGLSLLTCACHRGMQVSQRSSGV